LIEKALVIVGPALQSHCLQLPTIDNGIAIAHAFGFGACFMAVLQNEHSSMHSLPSVHPKLMDSMSLTMKTTSMMTQQQHWMISIFLTKESCAEK
jgi:hypothetical protein